MSEYSCVKSHIDGLYRVIKTEDVPWGTCYSMAETPEDAIEGAVRFLDLEGGDDIEIIIW